MACTKVIALSAAALLFALASNPFVIAAESQRQIRMAQTPDEIRLVTQVATGKGLKAAAAVFGHFVREVPVVFEGVGIADSLASVASQADVVIVGRPLTGHSYLSADGKDITTEWLVQAEEVLRDVENKVTGVKQLTVSVPGGRVDFPDGSIAEIRVPGYDRMTTQRRYWFALTPYRTEPMPIGLSVDSIGTGRFYVVMGPQGLFELPDDGSPVRAVASTRSIVAKQHNGRSVKEFLRISREAAAEANRVSPKGLRRPGG